MKIVVGMSGGVDSSVSLILLKNMGFDPIGVSLKLPVWENPKNLLRENIESALERAMFMKTIHVDPFAQGLRTIENPEPFKDIKMFCRWVNHKAIFKKVTWEEYIK